TTQTGTFTVCNDDEELRIALAWTDPPNAGAAALRNDLDLQITAPSGRKYRGNYFSDDNNRNKVVGTNEDCAPLGSANMNTANGAVDQGQWSRDICNL